MTKVLQVQTVFNPLFAYQSTITIFQLNLINLYYFVINCKDVIASCLFMGAAMYPTLPSMLRASFQGRATLKANMDITFPAPSRATWGDDTLKGNVRKFQIYL